MCIHRQNPVNTPVLTIHPFIHLQHLLYTVQRRTVITNSHILWPTAGQRLPPVSGQLRAQQMGCPFKISTQGTPSPSVMKDTFSTVNQRYVYV